MNKELIELIQQIAKEAHMMHHQQKTFMISIIRQLQQVVDDSIPVLNLVMGIDLKRMNNSCHFTRITKNSYISIGLGKIERKGLLVTPEMTGIDEWIDNLLSDGNAYYNHNGPLFNKKDQWLVDYKYLDEDEEADNETINSCSDRIYWLAENLYKGEIFYPIAADSIEKAYMRYGKSLQLDI